MSQFRRMPSIDVESPTALTRAANVNNRIPLKSDEIKKEQYRENLEVMKVKQRNATKDKLQVKKQAIKKDAVASSSNISTAVPVAATSQTSPSRQSTRTFTRPSTSRGGSRTSRRPSTSRGGSRMTSRRNTGSTRRSTTSTRRGGSGGGRRGGY